MGIVVLVAALAVLFLGAAAAGVVMPEAAGEHESYWVIEPHEQVAMGGSGVYTETVYVNRTYFVRHPPPPPPVMAHLDGCDRVPGYVHWWHSNATHRLADPGYVPFMEYGVHYADSPSKVMPDLQERIDAAGDDAELCITAVLTVSGAPGGLVYAGEDMHGGTNATLHAVAGFLQDRGAVLEDHWDWEYGIEYPPVDPGTRGGPYPGSEYPDLEFRYDSKEFVKHQLKQQISARVSPALADELAARPDVVALDAYGKWVGTPEFMFYNYPGTDGIAWYINNGVDLPRRINTNIEDMDFARSYEDGSDWPRIAFCPHMCPHERKAAEKASGYYDGMRDRHTKWLVSFIKDHGGMIGLVEFTEPKDKSTYLSFNAPIPLVVELDKLRIVEDLSLNFLAYVSQRGGMIQPPIPDISKPAPVKGGPVAGTGAVERPHGGNGGSGTHTPGPDASALPKEPRCGPGKVPFERPGRGDTVCVYPETAERLGARGPW